MFVYSIQGFTGFNQMYRYLQNIVKTRRKNNIIELEFTYLMKYKYLHEIFNCTCATDTII